MLIGIFFFACAPRKMSVPPSEEWKATWILPSVPVDSTNLDKLKTASELMRHISELSKSINGNFKELAKAIKEDLLEALENLTGALDGVNGKDFKVSVAGDAISKPSGSAGLAERRESQPLAGSQLTKADLDRIIRSINELSTKINRVITPDNKVQVKM